MFETIWAVGDAGGVDLAVDQEGRDARVLSLLHGRDRSVCAGIVENDRLGAAGDCGVDQFALLVCVVVMDEHQSLVAKLLGLRLGTRSASALKKGLSCDGVMMAIRSAA